VRGVQRTDAVRPPGTLFQIEFEWTRNEKAAVYVIAFFFFSPSLECGVISLMISISVHVRSRHYCANSGRRLKYLCLAFYFSPSIHIIWSYLSIFTVFMTRLSQVAYPPRNPYCRRNRHVQHRLYAPANPGHECGGSRARLTPHMLSFMAPERYMASPKMLNKSERTKHIFSGIPLAEQNDMCTCGNKYIA
jgi:hypothetical protein